MSQEATRQSQRIRDPSYRRRTTSRLPVILTVRTCIMHFYVPARLIFYLFFKNVTPTSFNWARDENHQSAPSPSRGCQHDICMFFFTDG